MLDNRLLRRSIDEVEANLARRGEVFDRARYQEREEQRRKLQLRVDGLHAERNRLAAALRGQSEEEREANLARGAEIKAELASLEGDFRQIQASQEQFLLGVPNLLRADVPDGAGEDDNRVVRVCGDKPQMDFAPKTHFELCPRDMDFAGATKAAGSRFVALRGDVARLHRALAQWMLDKHTRDHAYEEVYVPYIVEESSLVGTGQLPKFAHDLFRIEGERGLHLIPTGEVPLTNLCRDSILDADDLPLRLVAHTPCFRSEAGSYGKDTAGMIRQHQFDKVELVQICHPDSSDAALEELLGHAETILRGLGLPYRVVQLCAGDTGFAAHCTFDIEVWLPGQQRYREISSCSSFGDFQARRAAIRLRERQGRKTMLAHTINGSGLAVGRSLIALLENLQRADGRLTVPAVLQPYMGGVGEIELA